MKLEDTPAWDDAFGAALIGKRVLVGITRQTAAGLLQEQAIAKIIAGQSVLVWLKRHA